MYRAVEAVEGTDWRYYWTEACFTPWPPLPLRKLSIDPALTGISRPLH